MGASHHAWTQEEDDFLRDCYTNFSQSPSKIHRKMLAETTFTRSRFAIKDRIEILLAGRDQQELPFELMPATEVPAVFGIPTQQIKVYGSKGMIPSVKIGRNRYYDIAVLDALVDSIRGNGRAPDWEYFRQECEVMGIV